MPMLDMDLESLREYKGINPCPKDFDEYWAEALKELDSVKPCVEFIPSDFKTSYADCFNMYFTGVKGARIHAKYLKPKNVKEKHPALIMFHGYRGNSGDWVDKLPYVAMGYTVVAMDCRGQGGLSQDIGDFNGVTYGGHIIRGLEDKSSNLLFRHVFLDTAQLARIVMDMEDVDSNRVGVTGYSQGGGLTIACAALEPRIKKIAPVYPFLSDYKRVWQMDLAKEAYEELNYYFRFFDPLHKREDEIFTKLGYIDVKNLAKNIKSEVLFTATLLDNICPPSTQFAIYNRLCCKKELRIYSDFGHEALPMTNDAIFQFMSNL
ncbi:alpha/beta fold hydrolase [Candidatus Clostridium radicumherbarum]|uniref:Alpha/beta fold hydrolase n=1 Tax=Candidatus Clostridium radicumherbarum TaxID=3381662 RepID=A0ABW8TSE7_9CLOT